VPPYQREIDPEPAQKIAAAPTATAVPLTPRRASPAGEQRSVTTSSAALDADYASIHGYEARITAHEVVKQELARSEEVDQQEVEQWVQAGCNRPQPQPSPKTVELRRQVKLGEPVAAAARASW
jgi:hypothetical protein